MKILHIETEHTGPFKVLFEVLKEMMIEANIECYSSKEAGTCDSEVKKDVNCLKINAVDISGMVLINLKLDGENFSKFVCKKNKLLLGVNLGCFYKLIKSMGKNDILSLDVDHDNRNYLNIKIDSPDEKKDTELKMKLMDLEDSKISIPDIQFPAIITMDSAEFNKLCREMNNIAEYVEIQCLSDKIIFTCKGEYADRKTTYRTPGKDVGEDENVLVNIQHSGKTNQIIQGIFELKNLVMFSKCASLCSDIEIYIKNDYPLVIRYSVATLGRIFLCLAQVNSTSTMAPNFSDEDEDYSDD